MIFNEIKKAVQSALDFLHPIIDSKEPVTFKGTTAEWNALTPAEQAAYEVKYITDDVVAGNAYTSEITESSALSNIGTVANATQHDVNVAVDSALEDNVRYSTNRDADLDNLIKPGIYSIEVLNVANQHAPSVAGWMSLFVSCWDSSVGYVQQLAIDVDGNIWFRMSKNTTWYSWKQLAFQS